MSSGTPGRTGGFAAYAESPLAGGPQVEDREQRQGVPQTSITRVYLGKSPSPRPAARDGRSIGLALSGRTGVHGRAVRRRVPSIWWSRPKDSLGGVVLRPISRGSSRLFGGADVDRGGADDPTASSVRAARTPNGFASTLDPRRQREPQNVPTSSAAFAQTAPARAASPLRFRTCTGSRRGVPLCAGRLGHRRRR